ncbi:Lrp/AsnC family transcriptional regulator [Amycolatopsis vancoresmycina DSM 44592]|uniref:Lrp/AsnC family transcriptional regulator n=1 Tax=Amycolatopsis vancoresmycina DSM 44592 TaxID=1292037 RepID=R1IBK8_9PSEU|nr:Lrp/AsnC family transcriptional regulator [Amycolatopsis vancoresmycina DSM 44592]
MICASMRDMTMLDDVDRALIHALHIDGRAPFTKIGDVLGVSTQTVARRYRRLRAEASLRVVGLPDPQRAGQAEWMVRLTATPHTAQELAHALARRADTAWIKLMSGGTEICVNVQTTAASDHSPPSSARSRRSPCRHGVDQADVRRHGDLRERADDGGERPLAAAAGHPAHGERHGGLGAPAAAPLLRRPDRVARPRQLPRRGADRGAHPGAPGPGQAPDQRRRCPDGGPAARRAGGPRRTGDGHGLVGGDRRAPAGRPPGRRNGVLRPGDRPGAAGRDHAGAALDGGGAGPPRPGGEDAGQAPGGGDRRGHDGTGQPGGAGPLPGRGGAAPLPDPPAGCARRHPDAGDGAGAADGEGGGVPVRPVPPKWT